MDTTSTLRTSPQGSRAMLKMPTTPFSRQPKPVFAVLETAALEDEAAQAKINRRSDKAGQERLCKDYIPFAFSFPLCDLTILELENMAADSHATTVDSSVLSNNVNGGNSHVLNSLRANPTTFVPCVSPEVCTTVASSQATATESRGASYAVRVSRTLQYIYQKVIRRKIVTYSPSPKEPKFVRAYVEEELECGHIHVAHPSEIETLTARRRQCHDCQGFFGGLILSDKKPPVVAPRQPKQDKQAGHSWWFPVGFAFMAMIIIVALVWRSAPKSYIYTAPVDVWRVLSDVTPVGKDFEVVMQRVHEGAPLPPWEMRFCGDYRPLFEVGMSLTWFSYEDRGDCVSIARKDLGYVIDRGSDTWPLLAKNCLYHVNPGVKWGKSSGCNGRPMFD